MSLAFSAGGYASKALVCLGHWTKTDEEREGCGGENLVMICIMAKTVVCDSVSVAVRPRPSVWTW